ncbi:MAG: Ig-like domain-containing protein, partial [Gemmatimonadota bacterium]|nr:Ig-like domain-containing protein [Gemmatimonadota bacterium]
MNRPAELSLSVGDTATVRAVVAVTVNEAPVTVAWTSDNEAVARVDRNGHVTARGAGVTGITSRVGTAFSTTRVSVTSAPAHRDEVSVVARNIAPAPARTTIAPPSPPPVVRAKPADATLATPAPRSAAINGRRSATTPHFSHISVFYTDFYSRYASPEDQR